VSYWEAILGTAANNGRDKITIIASPGISDLGAWLEQLLAESTGKNGKGIISVVVRALATLSRSHGNDSLPVLSGGFGEKLLEPGSEIGKIPGEAMMVSVATVVRRSSENGSQYDTGILCARYCGAAGGTISSVRFRNFTTSMPIMAAGPYRSLIIRSKRPPMLGTPAKMWRKCSFSATCCIFEPGSVTVMKRFPASFSPTASFTRAKKYCL